MLIKWRRLKILAKISNKIFAKEGANSTEKKTTFG
jgi:hypothetical protein